MKPHVIGASRLASGPLFCAATDGSHDTVFVYDNNAWRRLVGWSGHEVTACCACGDTIVCAALDDVAYVINGTTISRVTLPEQTRATIYGACALSADSALLGGAGGLFLLSTRDLSAVRKRLSEFNVTRPGRHIHNIVRAGQRTLILGLKNLLVDYRGDAASEPVPRDALRGRELMFGDAVDVGGELWLSAGEGARRVLARLDGHVLQFHDAPEPGPGMPTLDTLGGELVVAAQKLSIGRPGAWRDVPVPPLTGDDAFAVLVPIEAGELCAITSGGRSFFTDGRACREVPVF